MHIAVIAANGRLGSVFVEEALARGHTIRAGIKGRNTLTPHPALEVMECDATVPDDLRRLLTGQEVVVSAIGHVKGSAPDVQTVATRAIVLVMGELGVSRYVDVTGTGVRFPGDKITLIDRILNFAVGVVDPNRVEDGRQHQKVLQESTLDWTTVRILKLQNVQPQPYTLTANGPTKWFVGRQEVARAMCDILEQNSFVAQSPIVSKQDKE